MDESNKPESNTAEFNKVEYRGRMKRNPAVRPRCLYCGALRPWWECECAGSEEVRRGKRAKPRIVHRGNRLVIVVDAETAERNVLGFERYAPPPPQIASAEALEDEGGEGVVRSFNRNSYMREYMRAKRRGG